MNNFPVVAWINDHLGLNDRIFVYERNIIYLLKPPVFYAHRETQAVVEIRRDSRDPVLCLKQLRAERITHLLAGPFRPGRSLDEESTGGLEFLVVKLWDSGCLRSVAQIGTVGGVTSRTLETARQPTSDYFEILAVASVHCIYDDLGATPGAH